MRNMTLTGTSAFTTQPKRDTNQHGFTLMEILTVVVIIGVLAAVAIPAGLAQKQRSVEAAMVSDVNGVVSTLQSDLSSWFGTPPDEMVITTETSETGNPMWTMFNTPDVEGQEPVAEDAGPLTPGNTASGTVWENGNYCVRITNPGTDQAVRFLSTEETTEKGPAEPPTPLEPGATPEESDAYNQAYAEYLRGACPTVAPTVGGLPAAADLDVPPAPANLTVAAGPGSNQITVTAGVTPTIEPPITSYLVMVPGLEPVEVPVNEIDEWESPTTIQPGSTNVTIRAINSNGAGPGFVGSVVVSGSILQDGTQFLGDVNGQNFTGFVVTGSELNSEGNILANGNISSVGNIYTDANISSVGTIYAVDSISTESNVFAAGSGAFNSGLTVNNGASINGNTFFSSPVRFYDDARVDGNLNTNEKALIGVDTSRNAGGYFTITPLDFNGDPITNKQLYYDIDAGRWSFEGATNTGGWVFDNKLTPHSGTIGNTRPDSELSYVPGSNRWEFEAPLGANDTLSVGGATSLNSTLRVDGRATLTSGFQFVVPGQGTETRGRLDPGTGTEKMVFVPTHGSSGTAYDDERFYFDTTGLQGWRFEGDLTVGHSGVIPSDFTVNGGASFNNRAFFGSNLVANRGVTLSTGEILGSEGATKQFRFLPKNLAGQQLTDQETYFDASSNRWVWESDAQFDDDVTIADSLTVSGYTSLRYLSVGRLATFQNGINTSGGNINIGCVTSDQLCTSAQSSLNDYTGNLNVGRNIRAFANTQTSTLTVDTTSTFNGTADFYGSGRAARFYNHLRMVNQSQVQIWDQGSGTGIQFGSGQYSGVPDANRFWWDNTGNRSIVFTPVQNGSTAAATDRELYFDRSAQQWVIEGNLLLGTVTNGHTWTNLTVSVPGVDVVSGSTPDASTYWNVPGVRRMLDGTVRLRGNLRRNATTVAGGAVTPTQYGSLCLVPLTTIPNTVSGQNYRPSSAVLTGAGATNRLEMDGSGNHTTWGDMNILVRADGTVSLIFPSKDGTTWRESDCVEAWDVMTTSHFYLDQIEYLASGV